MLRLAGSRSVVALVLLGWASGCRDGVAPRPAAPRSSDSIPGLIVSQPVLLLGAASAARAPGAVTATGVAYVSLPPGSVPAGLQATIRSPSSGPGVTVPVVNGGFDPVGVPGNIGDTVTVDITRGGGAGTLHDAEPVRANTPPVVVRTEPPPQKVDVPLNAVMVVVFSEPVDSATVTTATVLLLRDTTTVTGRLEFRDPAHLTVAFVPAVPLNATTAYALVVTTGVADLEGNRLEAELKVGFATAAAPAGLHLEFIEEPISTVAGATLNQGAAILVAIRDSLGNTITTATDSVTVAIGNNPNGGTLGGTRTMAAQKGIAQFTDLTLDKTSDGDPTGYTLTASAAGYAGANSTGFRIAPAPAARLTFGYRPPNALVGLPMWFPIYVTAQDAFGNTAAAYTGNVTVSIGTNPVGGALSGALTSTALGGTAVFPDLRIDQVGSGYTLLATASGLTGATSTAFDVAPATNLIAFVGFSGGSLSLADASGRGFASLGRGGKPAWSPDGSRIATGGPFCSSSARISVMNADGSGVVALGQVGSDPAWSPDGRKIAFDSGGSVYVMNADGSAPTRLTSGSSPGWSPDGTRIAYSSSCDPNTSNVYVMNADGSGVTSLGQVGSDPAWSPDGATIAFSSIRDGTPEIYVMNSDGSGVTRLTNGAWSSGPTWSPDGTRIAYSMAGADGGGPENIYVMSADGSGAVQLVPPLVNASGDSFTMWNNTLAAWRP